MLGGNYANDEILEWDVINEEWKEIGKMKQSRSEHSIAVVDVADVIDYCTVLKCHNSSFIL